MTLRVRKCSPVRPQQVEIDYRRAGGEERKLQLGDALYALARKYGMTTLDMKDLSTMGLSPQRIDGLLGAVCDVVGAYRIAGPTALRAVPELVRTGFDDSEIVQLITSVSLFYVGFRGSEREAAGVYRVLPGVVRELRNFGRPKESIFNLVATSLRKTWRNEGFALEDLPRMARVRMTDEEILAYFDLPCQEDPH